MKFGPVTLEISMLNCTHRKRIFRKTIFRPLGVLRPQIFTRAREWPSLTSAPPPVTRASLTIFFQRGSKIGLKCSKWALISSELGGVARRNFGTWRVFRMGCGSKYNILGHRPLKIWEGKKRPKFSTFYNNFRVWPQISLDWIDISTSGKRGCVNFSPLTPAITRLMFTNSNKIFRKTLFLPLEGAAPLNFYRRHRMTKSY